MAIRTLQVLRAVLGGEATGRHNQYDAPARIVFDAAPGSHPAGRPPVRIFIGTEAGQFRAERVLLWSIHRHRDPGRVYEIYLMKDLHGFRRHRWLTGFTNYRFLVPHLAGNTGKAIYNDVDQIYFRDPALLFDIDTDGHGYRSINAHDSSVMLIDCERMGRIWTPERARTLTRRRLDALARETPGLWGELDGGWNSRDTEYRPGASGLLHFTKIHSQPWRPFPSEYVYERNPVADIWFALEQEADAAGFQPFTAEHPGPGFHESIRRPGTPPAARLLAPLRTMLESLRPQNIVCVGPAAARVAEILGPVAGTGTPSGIVEFPASATALPDAAGIVCAGLLETVPDWDVGWVLDRLFAASAMTLHLALDLRAPALPGRHRRDPLWWYAQVSAAARRRPLCRWQLAVMSGRRRLHCWGGGRPQQQPCVLVIGHYKTGHDHQALDLARALGWPFDVLKVQPLHTLHGLRQLLSTLPGMQALGDIPRPGNWPDLVIASGWLPVRFARIFGRLGAGRTLQIRLGRKSGPADEAEDITVSCRHFRMWPHPRRIESLLPPHGIDEIRKIMRDAVTPEPAQPCFTLVVGGTSRNHRLDTSTAERLGREMRRFAESAGARLAVITSRRTGRAAERALRAALGDACRFVFWTEGARRPEYLVQLAAADVLIVTGESESMLAETIATGKPLYLYPLPCRRTGPFAWLAGIIEKTAYRFEYNIRGSVQPQQGFRYLCARLIERGIVLPPRRLEPLHTDLIRAGLARRFGEPLDTAARPARDESRIVAAQVRSLLGWETAVPIPDRPRIPENAADIAGA
jgi:mitochondrial fission protein ELM1